MLIFSRIEDFPALSKNTVSAIGNFDGIHLGHRKILQFLVQESKKQDLPSLVLTFSPHPEKFFGKKPVQMIQTLNQRLEEIKKNNIDMAFVLPFSDQIANLSSRDFIQKILIEMVHAEEIIVGENFRFGKNREGNSRILQRLSSICGFKFYSLPTEKKDGRVVSSSLIRIHLNRGEIQKANRLLGRPYEITGTVIKGQSRGKNLGYPTANISSENEIFPSGIFFTTVETGSERRPSLTSIGTRPTFDQKETVIEVYIIDFSANLYGQTLKIQLLKKLRDEIKFDTPEQLADQITKDLSAAKSYFRLS
ncbi:MAG: bifunctional riboflavin kinase/FAD synthetase [Candidatus Aminicenantes bacterium]|jgi:riboflavin kinase/FMN adenylyltransferase